AGEIDPAPWQEEIVQHFQHEIKFHFAAEEREIFPVAQSFEELKPLVEELLAEHAVLRQLFARAESGSLDSPPLGGFVESLALHIRKEERQLFEPLQLLMGPEDMAKLGSRIKEALAEVSQVCGLPKKS